LTSGWETLQGLRHNKYRAFKLGNNNQKSGAHRFRNTELYYVHHNPKFRVSKDDRVFTMGSCFAREVESALSAQSVDVLLMDFVMPMDYVDQSAPRITQQKKYADAGYNLFSIRSVLNKYSSASMVSEFERLFTEQDIENEGLIEALPGQWFDPQASQLKMLDFERAMDARRRISAATAKVGQASLVFLTLGLTETWRDTQTGLALNRVPPPFIIKNQPERFEFRNATHEEVVDDIHRVVELVRSQCNRDMRFVITVSPVPLGMTFTDKDVVVANAYSKSTLLSAAQQVCSEYKRVDYFPSYEMVINTSRELAWEPDQVHVLPSLVRQVTNRFLETFMGD